MANVQTGKLCINYDRLRLIWPIIGANCAKCFPSLVRQVAIQMARRKKESRGQPVSAREKRSQLSCVSEDAAAAAAAVAAASTLVRAPAERKLRDKRQIIGRRNVASGHRMP